ncbi:MAG: FtsX-like permease family protein, partial [Bacteroidota bacterium]
TEWDWDGFMTYIWLGDGVNPKDFESKLPAFVDEQHGEQLERFASGLKFYLQPITDIHLYSDYMMEYKPNGDGQITYFLLVIAIFIIVIAWVNYINLATAKSMERAKEVGIRKVMGSFRKQLMSQFFIESVVLNLIAAILSLFIIYLALPLFNQLAGRSLTLSFADPQLWMTITGLFLFGGLLSGIYPAIVLSGFKPVSVLKGKIQNTSKGAILRKGLVVFQFFASLVLMVGTYIVFSQLSHMRSQNLGVKVEQTLVVKGPNVTDSLYSDKLNTFKNSLVSYSSINSITASTAVPGEQPDWNAGGIRLVEEDDSESNQYRVIGMDYDFVNAYGLEVLEGRSFDRERTTDQNTVLLNEAGAKLIGFDTYKEALNRDMFFWGDTFKIVGVVKNYHQESLKKSFEPLVFRLIPNASNYYSLKVNTEGLNSTIDLIEEEWMAMFPGNPFDFFFLDDHFEKQYRADVQFGQVFGLFASLAIFIACLGLFGLASYMTAQRTKEIGVRKVLGASISSILTLLSKDFTKLILIAVIFAVPLSWWVMSDWLESFAYKMKLSWWVFAIPAIVLLSVALFTVSFQTLKAAWANPVDSLRNE